ncbi:1-acyl-sn-glycerol-3-phosphate acyltransferase gamma [Xylocopa sonorina]|uniref:1-acyl-sn-glycerol-3-phosphate acyltransferase gamma n=1 Tax=Xylocopa sonorina TaxID=1818115 RepID=UPI00403AD1BD
MSLLLALKQSSIVRLMFAITFFTSGLIVNFFQFILYFGLRPFSRYFYRKINYYLCYSLFSHVVFLVEWWSGTTYILYSTKESVEKYYGTEHGYLLMNHQYEIDWLIGWCFCDYFGLLGNCRAYAKKSLQYVPSIGWAWKFAEFIFLDRNWKEDQNVIKTQIKEFTDYPDSMMLLMYAEGTRFTKQKLEASQKFAREKGLPLLKHHLTPRTKGFVASLRHMRGKFPAIYDIEILFNPNDPVKPTLTNLLLGKPLLAHLYVNRIPLEEVPEDDEGAAEWLHKLYQKKDNIAESFYQTGDLFATSGVPKLDKFNLKKRYYPVICTTLWAVIILVPMIYYLVNLFLSGSIISFSIGVGIIFLFYLLMQKTIGFTEVSHGSSYGTDNKKSK